MEDMASATLACLEAITLNPQDHRAWHDGLWATTIQRDADVQILLALMGQKGINRIYHLAVLVDRLVGDDEHHVVLAWLADQLRDTPFESTLLCGLGVASYLRFCNLERTVDCLERALTCAFNRDYRGLSVVEREHLFNYMKDKALFYGITVLRPEEFLPAAFGEEEPLTFPDMQPGAMVVLSACDKIYFQKYGRQFAENVSRILPDATCLIHVINSDDEGNRL